MPINAHPDYLAAEKEYLSARTLEEKIKTLKKMISLAPSHKGAENLRADLRSRLKRFEEKLERGKKAGKTSKQGIKKEEIQAVIVGKTNSGKSLLLSFLTNTKPKISGVEFTTKEPQVGMMNYGGVLIQIIEIPAVESEFYDKGLVNTADIILVLIKSLKALDEINQKIENAAGKKIIVFNIFSQSRNEIDERKLEATLKSKKLNFVVINTETGENFQELKEKLFQSSGKIRIYTKEPTDKMPSEKPFVLNQSSTIEDLTKRIFHKDVQIKEIKIWGPSSKFPGQVVGMKHVLKDLDIVEFKTR